MNPQSSPLSDIRNFHPIGERIGTAGQPARDQFALIRQAGFDVVINLALPTSTDALPDEGSIVTSHGMAYLHIPVDFATPAPAHFRLFCQAMDGFSGQRVFVHCVANKRVSAFLYLYRILRQGVALDDAARDLTTIWEPDPAWARFIEDQLQANGSARGSPPLG